MRCCSLYALCIGVGAIIVAFGLCMELMFLRLDYLRDVDQVWTCLPNVSDRFEWDGQRPLNVLFMTWGSRGDHQPNIALGVELGRRGHNVTVFGLTKYRAIVERHEPWIRYAPLQDDYVWQLAEQFGSSEGTDFLELSRAYAVNSSRQLISQYVEEGRHADVLFGNHAAMLILHHLTVAQFLQKPLFLTTHDLTLPTSSYAFDLAENRVKDYGRRTNVWNHRLFSLLFGAVLTFGDCHWRMLRSELGLSTPWPFMEILSPKRLADFPVFYSADPTLWPPPSDHPPHWYSTGFFVTPVLEGAVTSRAIQEWMDSRRSYNRPIVYFGQGSFSHHDRTAFTDILLDACESLHMDAVALESTIDNRTDLPPSVLTVPEADQEWLFPRCAVVVHHGGAGTSSQCIRSGTPGICVPSMPFQEIWGGRLEEHGAGVLLRPQEALHAWSSENRTNLLTRAIQRATAPSVRQKAAELGSAARSVCDQRGVKLAADAMEKHLRSLVKSSHRIGFSGNDEL